MSIQKVKEYFKQFEMDDKILEFEVSSATVELAALALGCEGKRIAKTLSFLVDNKPILIVTAGDARIDNPKYKQQFQTKAKMPNPTEVLSLIGYEVGGVCPFAIDSTIPIYLDVSLKRFDTVFPACGSSNSAIELTMQELEKHSHALGWIDVCKNWE